MKGNATSLTRRSDYTDELVYSRDPEANTSLFATGEFLNGKTVKPFTSTCDGQLLACAALLQSMPVSCHFRDCKALLSRIVSGAIYLFTFICYKITYAYKLTGSTRWRRIIMYDMEGTECPVYLWHWNNCWVIDLGVRVRASEKNI